MRLLLLGDVFDVSSAEVGGKARNLSKLLRAGFPVPQGWVIPAGVFREQLAAWGINVDSPETGDVARIEHGEMAGDLLQCLTALPDTPIAVRSSAAAEDGASASYSGIFDTILGVRGREQLGAAVRQVWASAFTPEALAYHRQVSQAGGCPPMAVLLMPMVDAIAAGVAFSADPVDGNPFVIAISAAHGLGTTVVNGRAPVDRYLLDWDTLAVKEQDPQCKREGVFLTSSGNIRARAMGDPVQEQAVLDEPTLDRIGRLVRDVDGLFDTRVDVEFAVTPPGVVLLQARPIVGLPPCFPNDPRAENSEILCCHTERMDPLSPYSVAQIETMPEVAFPRPPWPMEAGRFLCRHGRVFSECPEDPEVTENPEAAWEDRGFITRMLAFDEPALAFRQWYEYAELIYGRMIPEIRDLAQSILRLQIDDLHDLPQYRLAQLAEEAIQLDSQASVLYQATSYPTYETLRRIDILIRDGLRLDWRTAQQLALTMIQGAPKLTHLRDSEVEEAAHTGRTDDLIARWGYSFLRRDELLDMATWKSWREDPTPLQLALSNLRKATPVAPMAERVKSAQKESEERFLEARDTMRADKHGRRYAEVFAECVHASRRLFPLKDDRDLVLSHAQSATRWTLLEAGRRLRTAGCVSDAEEVFLLRPEEIVAGIASRLEPHEIAALADDRREKQRRLARYTLSRTPPAPEDKDGFTGWPASKGIAEGPVRVITTDRPDEIMQLQPGEILWLRGEAKVGWTMYFPLIAGLIYEFGNWLCHETNLCRELGIPAVVGFRDTLGLRTGDVVRIDGAEGAVVLVQRRDQ